MKKKIYILVITFLFVFSGVFLLLRSANSIKYTEEESIENEELYITLLNSDGLYEKVFLIGEEEKIDYIIDLYKNHNYVFPVNYSNPLNFSDFSYYYDNDTLELKINDDVPQEDILMFLKALYISLEPYDIKEVKTNYNNHLFKINSKSLINVVMETSDFSKANKTTIFYKKEDNILPLTYLHQKSSVEFILNKLVAKNFSYEIDNDKVILTTENNISDETKKELEMSLNNIDFEVFINIKKHD